MSDDHLISLAIGIARKTFNAPDLAYQPNLAFQSIRGFDSVQAVQFVLALEEALDVTLNEQEIDSMLTLGDMLKTLRAKTQPA